MADKQMCKVDQILLELFEDLRLCEYNFNEKLKKLNQVKPLLEEYYAKKFAKTILEGLEKYKSIARTEVNVSNKQKNEIMDSPIFVQWQDIQQVIKEKCGIDK